MYADKFHSKTTPPRFVTAGDGRAAHLDVAVAAGQRHLVPAALS